MPATDVLLAVESAAIDHFGHRPVRASVSFVGVDPIEVLRFEPIPGERVYLTLGMSRHPMTPATEQVLAAAGPRAELLLHLADPTDRWADVWRRLAMLAAAPAVEGVVYRAGMSIDLAEPLVPGSACTGALVERSSFGPVQVDEAFEVEVFRVLPATAHELAWCRVRGSEALGQRWSGQGVDLLDLARPGVGLAD